MNWHYEEAPLNGGAPGDAYKSTFNGSGKKPAAVLAREAIQNSVDAATDATAAVRVEFRFRRLKGADRIAFEDAAALGDMRPRETRLKLPYSNALKEPRQKLELLYIDDFETTGLKGDPGHPSSNLRKLLMDLGGSDKAQDKSGSGGSYGFGKAVYSSNSRIGTIFAYSRTHDSEGEPITLLMGCAYQAGHEYDGTGYTGRAWLGNSVEVPNRGVRFDPLTGVEAEDLAARLGFSRASEEIGTSILLVDTGLEPEDLVAGIEDWWWPRIEARLLETTVFSCRGEEMFPRPKLRAHLRPFLNAFDSAVGKSPDIQAQQQRKPFNKMHGVQIGTLGAVVLDDSEEENPLGEDYEGRLDTVALVRGPLMVVDYYQNWRLSATAPRAVGCFVAGPDIDVILKLSEPPAHDRWDPTAQRLSLEGDQNSKIVESVLRRIKTAFRDFQNSAKPPVPPRPRRLAKLERDLASWFGVGPKQSKVPPPPGSAPISLRPYGPHIEPCGEGLRASGSVEVGIGKEARGADQPFRIRLALQVAEEDGFSVADSIRLEITPDTAFQEMDDGFWVGIATDEAPARLSFVSAPYDPTWTVRLVPEVLPVEETSK